MANSNQINLHEGDARTISIQDLWVIAVRRAWVFVLFFLPVLVMTIAYLITAPLLYQSTAVVQVEQREQRAFKSIERGEDLDDLKGDDIVKTIEQNLQNYSLFVNVVSDPKISEDPDFLVGYSGSHSPPEIDDLAKWLRSNTNVSLRHGTRLIDITVDHRVPRMAQRLAQAIVDAFVEKNIQDQSSTQLNALKFLVTQSEGVKENLQKSEDSLATYKDALLLKDRIDDQQRVLDALRQRYREKHPQLIQARMLLADLNRTFDIEFKKVTTNSSAEAAYWAGNASDLDKVSLEDRISTEIKLVQARSEVLQKEIDTESALFDNILKQVRETNLTEDSTPKLIHLVEPPPLPEKDKPDKPKKKIVLLLGLMSGVVLGVFAMAIANALDSSIRSTEEAESVLGLPVLGVIPKLSAKKSTRAGPRPQDPTQQITHSPPPENELVLVTEPSGAAAEGFRSLRAAVNLLGKSSENRSVLFASALAGEGKTFVSCNYALALAQSGMRTLLIDADLRIPSVHRLFKFENTVGFLELVVGDLELAEVVHANAVKNLNMFQTTRDKAALLRVVHSNVVKNLDVLSAGGKCPNPAELLAGSGFKDVLKKALASYDRVVIDCAPVNLVSDPLLIAASIDVVCLVVHATHTPRQVAQKAITLLRRAQREPSGLLLNALPLWGNRFRRQDKKKISSSYGSSYS